jgi:hypothetical protein
LGLSVWQIGKTDLTFKLSLWILPL